MPQYFISGSDIISGRCTLTGDDFRHLAVVRRAKAGDKISLRSDTGESFSAEIILVSGESIEAEITGAVPEKKTDFELTLCCAVLKGGATGDVIRMAAETGVAGIIPMITERTAAGSIDKMNDKLGRWRRIVAEASKQCMRSNIPIVGEVARMQDIIAFLPGMKLIAHPGADISLNALTRPAEGWAAVFIGPEGGFSPGEIDTAAKAGAVPVSFGNAHLRAATACAVIPAIIMHDWGYSWI